MPIRQARRAAEFISPHMVAAHQVLDTQEEMAEQFECAVSTIAERAKQARHLGLRPTLGPGYIAVQPPTVHGPRPPYLLELPGPSARVVTRMRRYFTVPQVAWSLDITVTDTLEYQENAWQKGHRRQIVQVPPSPMVLVPDDQLMELCAVRSAEAAAAELDCTIAAVRDRLDHAAARGYSATHIGPGAVTVLRNGVEIDLSRSWENWTATAGKEVMPMPHKDARSAAMSQEQRDAEKRDSANQDDSSSSEE